MRGCGYLLFAGIGLIDSSHSVMDNCFTVFARCLVNNTGDSVFRPLKNYCIGYFNLLVTEIYYIGEKEHWKFLVTDLATAPSILF